MKLELSIIIPTKDRGGIFKQTVESALLSIAQKKAEIIIINDSKIPIKEISPSSIIHIYQNTGNGVASARNLGAAKASSDYLLFLDDDILININVINKLLQYAKDGPHKIFLPNWVYPNELNSELGKTSFGRFILKHKLNSLKGWINLNSWSEIDLMEIKSGASFCLLIHKSKFNSINGYNEKFPYAGAEDYDFCERLKSNGTRFFIDPYMVVHHNEADRISLINWLNRKKRDSATKKLALNLGYTEFVINYSLAKIVLCKTIYFFRILILLLVNIIPNKRIFDKLYNNLILTLCAGYIYKGYKEF